MPGLPVPIINDVTLAPPAGQITVTGHAPALRLTLEVPTGAVTVEGHAPTVAISEAGAPPPGEITVTGLAPSITFTLEPPAGEVSVAGLAPTLATVVAETPIPRGAVWRPLPSKDVALRVDSEGRIYIVALNPQLSIDSSYEEELVLALA